MEKIREEQNPPDSAHPCSRLEGQAVVQAPLQPINSVLLPQVPLLEWHHLPSAGVFAGIEQLCWAFHAMSIPGQKVMPWSKVEAMAKG